VFIVSESIGEYMEKNVLNILRVIISSVALINAPLNLLTNFLSQPPEYVPVQVISNPSEPPPPFPAPVATAVAATPPPDDDVDNPPIL
jgi:hypothetical protein